MLLEGGDTVWSASYEGEPGDPFAFCDDLAARADMDMRVQINAFDGDRIAHLPDEALNVAELRARGAGAFYELTPDSFRRCLALMDRALRLKPGDPMAIAMRAEAVLILTAAEHGALDPGDAARLGRDLDRAVEQEPRGDYVFYARSAFRVFVARDPEAARQDSDRALAINHHYAPGWEQRGLAKMLEGDFEGAAADLRAAVAYGPTDAFSVYRGYLAAVALLAGGRPEEAAAALSGPLDLRSSDWGLQRLMAEIARAMGDPARAEACEARAAALHRRHSVLAPRPPLPGSHADLADRLRAGS